MSTQHVISGGPDPSAIRLMPVPDPWPPDDPGEALAMDPWIRAGADPGGYPSAGHGTVPRADPVDGDRAWPHQFAVVLAETLAGVRPVRQIQPWLSKRGSIHLHRVLPLFASGHRPRVQRVITARLSPDVIEMTMIVAVGPRARALAIRLERAPTSPGDAPGTQPEPCLRTQRDRESRAVRWVCTDIETA